MGSIEPTVNPKSTADFLNPQPKFKILGPQEIELLKFQTIFFVLLQCLVVSSPKGPSTQAV